MDTLSPSFWCHACSRLLLGPLTDTVIACPFCGTVGGCGSSRLEAIADVLDVDTFSDRFMHPTRTNAADGDDGAVETTCEGLCLDDGALQPPGALELCPVWQLVTAHSDDGLMVCRLASGKFAVARPDQRPVGIVGSDGRIVDRDVLGAILAEGQRNRTAGGKKSGGSRRGLRGLFAAVGRKLRHSGGKLRSKSYGVLQEAG